MKSADARPAGAWRRIELTIVTVLCAVAVALVGFTAVPAAQAEPQVESLMVPSASMGRDIPVAFMGGGPHAVFLLDAFNAGETVSNWVRAGNAMNTLAGKGISVVAPAGGAYSLYTNWEQDGSRQWETFLSAELPDWLVANKGLAPGGHAIVGASQGGTGALTLAEFYPFRFRYAGSMSGFLTPSATTFNGAITDGMMRFGSVDTRNMWGLPQLGRWKWHDPDVHIALLVNNNTRLWVFSPQSLTASDQAAMLGYADQAQGSNLTFTTHYRMARGNNGHFDLPVSGDHGWASWGPQLAAMSGDMVNSIK